MVSSAERQKLSRTSTSTPSTSKIKISGIGLSRFNLRKVGKAPHGGYRRYRASVYPEQRRARPLAHNPSNRVSPSSRSRVKSPQGDVRDLRAHTGSPQAPSP